MKISIPTFAAILLIVFLATLYMANADPFLSSVQIYWQKGYFADEISYTSTQN